MFARVCVSKSVMHTFSSGIEMEVLKTFHKQLMVYCFITGGYDDSLISKNPVFGGWNGRATISTDPAMSSQGNPILIIDGKPISPQEITRRYYSLRPLIRLSFVNALNP